MARRSAAHVAASITRGALSAVAIAVVLIVLALPRSADVLAGWADLDPALWMLDRVAGGSLVIAGIAATWLVRPSSPGTLAIVAGLAWLAPALVGAASASDVWRSVALLLAPMLLPATALLAVRCLDPDLTDDRTRRVLAVLVTGAVVLAVARTTTYLPAEDPRCWAFCSPDRNVLAIGEGEWTALNRALTTAGGVAVALGWAWLALWAGRRRRRGGTPSRPLRWIMAGAVVVGIASAAWALAGLLVRSDPPSPYSHGVLLAPLWLARAIGVLLLAVGVAPLAVKAQRQARALRSAVEALEAIPSPGGLQAALATSLGDPSLTVAYVLDDGHRMVDASGAPIPAPSAGEGRALTTIERVGRPVAVVMHDASLDGRRLLREIGAAARLAVDNERLRASVLARVADLRASRARIVSVADEERRRLERDLHDGAQQRLLALSYEIRVALTAARRAGDDGLIERLSTADTFAQSAIRELRQLAHGIHPAILRDTGLAPALATLADDAPLPMELDAPFRGRCAQATEIAAYHVVADALLEATRAGASHLTVRLSCTDGTLAVEVDHDGPADAPARLRATDRVGALGGRVRSVTSPTGSGRTLRAELPCA